MSAVLDAPEVVITEPGVYDLPEHVYLSDPVPGGSLSFSGAKALLPPSCPARFRYERDHGRPPKAAFDFGHAVHALTLGAGEPIVAVDAPDWRGKAAREQRDAAYAAGHAPLLAADLAAAQAAADAVRAHPNAGPLLSSGVAERSLFWQDDRHGVWRRSRLDWITEHNGRTVVVDLKTTQSIDRAALTKTISTYRYWMQHPYYLDGVRALDLAVNGEEPVFLLAFVEVRPPHLLRVVELSAPDVEMGRRAIDRALGIYARCTSTDTWPDDTDDIPVISLPPWAFTDLDLDMETSA